MILVNEIWVNILGGLLIYPYTSIYLYIYPSINLSTEKERQRQRGNYLKPFLLPPTPLLTPSFLSLNMATLPWVVTTILWPRGNQHERRIPTHWEWLGRKLKELGLRMSSLSHRIYPGFFIWHRFASGWTSRNTERKTPERLTPRVKILLQLNPLSPTPQEKKWWGGYWLGE